MEGEKSTPIQQAFQKEKSSSTATKKTLTVIGAIITSLTVAGVSYFLGTQSVTNKKVEPSATPPIALTTPFFEPPQETDQPTPSSTSAAKIKTPTPTLRIKTKIINSTPSLDGFRSSNGEGSNTAEIKAGRNTNLVTRGYVSFDLGGLEQGITIEQASLRLYQAKTVGNPYGVGKTLKVDHLTYGDSLDSSDYARPALLTNIATLATNDKVEWKDADVTEAVKDDAANARSRSQFRIHFTTEVRGGDKIGDFVFLDSSNDYTSNTGHTPQLVINYH